MAILFFRSIGFKLFLLLFALASAPAQAWWNCSWTKRSVLSINNTGAAQANANVEMTLLAAQLPGYTWPTNYADIRLVDADDLTELAFYVEPLPVAQQRLHVFFTLPSLPTGSKNIFVYYGNATATVSALRSINIFSTQPSGVRLSTRSSTADPVDQAGYFTAWNVALATPPAGYGCRVLPDYTNRSNANVFTGATSNILYSMHTVLNVPTGQAGTWGVRLGGDYGRGGSIYVDGTIIAQNWTGNLWWANNWANATVLTGTINLTAGRHLITTYGAEDCCDGTAAIQLQRPAGAWTDLNTTNFTLNAPSCSGIVTPTTLTEPYLVKVTKTALALSDPSNGTTNPKSIPGAKLRFKVNVQNNGGGQTISANTLQISDVIPPNVNLVVSDINSTGSGPVKFTNSTAPVSGITYTYAGLASATDDLSFLNVGGTSITPTAGTDGSDPAVRSILINPKNTFQCTTTTAPNSVQFEFDVIIK